jgi:hypothetical protein
MSNLATPNPRSPHDPTAEGRGVQALTRPGSFPLWERRGLELLVR